MGKEELISNRDHIQYPKAVKFIRENCTLISDLCDSSIESLWGDYSDYCYFASYLDPSEQHVKQFEIFISRKK